MQRTGFAVVNQRLWLGIAIGLILAAATTVAGWAFLRPPAPTAPGADAAFSDDTDVVIAATPSLLPDQLAEWENQDAALIYRRAFAVDWDALSGRELEFEPFLVFLEEFDFSSLIGDDIFFSGVRTAVTMSLWVIAQGSIQADALIEPALRDRMIRVSVDAIFDEAYNVKGAAVAALWALGYEDGERGTALDPNIQELIEATLDEPGVRDEAEGLWSGFGRSALHADQPAGG